MRPWPLALGFLGRGWGVAPAWGSAVVGVVRLAGRGYADANFVGGSTGFRLVLRPRPSGQ